MGLMQRFPESPDNDSIRELRDELKDLNQTFKKTADASDRVSLVIIAFTFVQIVIALFQFFLNVKTIEGFRIGTIIFVILLLYIVFIIKFFIRKKEK